MREAWAAEGGTAQRLVDAAVGAVVLLIPLVGWPRADHPFSTPKFIALVAALVPVIALAIAGGRVRRPAAPPACAVTLLLFAALYVVSAALATVLSPQAVVLQGSATAWFLVVLACRPAAAAIVRALVASATVVAGVAVLQWAWLDPFALMGYVGDSTGRMRVYGTLGNPDFVAVFLVSALPLTVALGVIVPRRRTLACACGALQSAALVATGSRAAALALVSVGFFLILTRGRRRALILAFIVAAAAAIVVFSTGRSLGETVAGRLYIWRVTAPHVAERPLAGFGPGAFEPMYVGWQADAWRARRFTRWYRRFTALQDHAHNDFLEIAVDSGVPAAAAFAGFIVSLLFARRRARGPVALAASCSVVAISAAALVDFPFHRPGELFVFWMVAGVVALEASLARGDHERRVGAQSGQQPL